MLRGFRLSAICFIVLLVIFQVGCFAKTVYVSTTGLDTNDGLTWVTAKRMVQSGLNTAVSGDEVWVAQGTYTENITLTTGAALYGGFKGSETSRDQRNWSINTTIIDGHKSGSAVTSPAGATRATQIDGFTIMNGTGGSFYAGISCTSSSVDRH